MLELARQAHARAFVAPGTWADVTATLEDRPWREALESVAGSVGCVVVETPDGPLVRPPAAGGSDGARVVHVIARRASLASVLREVGIVAPRELQVGRPDDLAVRLAQARIEAARERLIDVDEEDPLLPADPSQPQARVDLRGAPWRTAVARLAKAAECLVEDAPGAPLVLRPRFAVRAAPAAPLPPVLFSGGRAPTGPPLVCRDAGGVAAVTTEALVDLDVVDADVGEVAAEVVRLGGRGRTFDPRVSTRVTLSLRRAPWRRALAALAKLAGAVVHVEGGDDGVEGALVLEAPSPVQRADGRAAPPPPATSQTSPPPPATSPPATQEPWVVVRCREVELSQVIDAFQEASGQTVALDEAVWGPVTLDLPPLPWPVALRRIVKAACGELIPQHDGALRIGRAWPMVQLGDVTGDAASLIQAIADDGGLELDIQDVEAIGSTVDETTGELRGERAVSIPLLAAPDAMARVLADFGYDYTVVEVTPGRHLLVAPRRQVHLTGTILGLDDGSVGLRLEHGGTVEVRRVPRDGLDVAREGDAVTLICERRKDWWFMLPLLLPP